MCNPYFLFYILHIYSAGQISFPYLEGPLLYNYAPYNEIAEGLAQEGHTVIRMDMFAGQISFPFLPFFYIYPFLRQFE